MFYLINKHSGLTSFGVIHFLRKKFGIKKMGHTGTLDPLATGLLLIATDNSTKLIPYIEKANKTYKFSFRIDGHSPTGDLEGEIEYINKEILERKKKEITIKLIEKIIKQNFSGKITQIPPKYSAIKIDGKKAYELARGGQEFEMKKREIEIFSYKFIEYNFPTITLEMTVSAGTYVRTIAEDIGKALGLNGYVTLLHRSKIDFLDEELSKNLEEIEVDNSIGENILFPDFEEIEVDDNNAKKILNGMEVIIPELTDGKKYFVKNNGKIFSLIEIINGKTKILINGLN